jgi:hypothetical protein
MNLKSYKVSFIYLFLIKYLECVDYHEAKSGECYECINIGIYFVKKSLYRSVSWEDSLTWQKIHLCSQRSGIFL